MSYNGSGTFNINSTGQPVVAGTVITASAFNALTTDLATGLTTAITKDGQTTTTARITFAQGITSSLVTDSSSVSTGSIITAGGAGIAKNLYVGVNANVAGTLGVTGVATFSAAPIYSSLTASSAVATDASKGLVSVTNTGTGNNVLATSPTITTPTISSLSSAAATALTLQSAGTTAITVDTSQNVGIGTASPSGKLHVAGGASNANFYLSNNSYSSYYYQNTGGTSGVSFPASQAYLWDSGGTERMRIDSSGTVGIGVTPSAWTTSKKVLQASNASFVGQSDRYEIWSNGYYDGTNVKYISTGYISLLQAVNGSTAFQIAPSGTAGTNATLTQAMTLDASGNLLVGTTTSSATNGSDGFRVIGGGVPTVQRGVNGSFAAFYNNADSASIGSISNSGGTVTLYNTTSDQRLKENIVDAPEFGDIIDSIKVRSFDWKSGGTHQRAGFIAQELVTVAPEAVHQPTDSEEMMAVDYSKLVPMLVKEIQSLRQRLSAANL